MRGKDPNGIALREIEMMGFPGGSVDKNSSASARDMGSIPGLGGSHIPWSN